ncbi:nuclease-related domain-containing DEAD/DEAH box helicase [Thiocapsa imhoffii]|nr:NERD domain-containing protein/DEAD/DEAH box helicase [Thiocapsa imhoffii]
MSDNTEAVAIPAVRDTKGELVIAGGQPKIASRRDLARYIGIPLRWLAAVLYDGDRSRLYTVREIPKASGGTRTLHAVAGKLKQVQPMLLDKPHREECFSRAKTKPPEVVPWRGRLKQPLQDIYTVVPALWCSLIDIFNSMYTSIEKGEIEVVTNRPPLEGFSMASVYPSLENIKRLRVPPTTGELFLVEYLAENLDDGFEIYFNPFLDGDRPDLIILRQGVGAFVIEVKDWDLRFYRVDGKNIWHVDDNKGNARIIKSPMAQAFTYKKNLYDLHLPVLGLQEIQNPNFFNIVQCFVYFHGPSDSASKNIFDQAVCEAAHEIEALNASYSQSSKSKTEYEKYEKSRSYFSSKRQQITRDRAMSFTRESVGRLARKISQNSTHVLFDDRVYDDFVRRLRPPEQVKKQGILPDLDRSQSKMAESRQGYEKVKGVAGCGKTTILAARACNACKRHDGRVLILTFNITLKNLIRDKLSEIEGSRNNPRIDVSNYHQFFNSQVNDVGLDMADLVKRYTLERLYDVDIFHDKNTFRYKTILLDEVQDYKSEWVKIIRDNFVDEDAEMVIFGDQAQNIYGRQEGRASVIAQGFGRWNKLNKNYRTAENSPLNQLFKDFQLEFLIQKYSDAEII